MTGGGIDRKGAKTRRGRKGGVPAISLLRKEYDVDVFGFREFPEPGAYERTEVLARRVIGAAIEVHRVLGPGLPENVYRRALSHELTLLNIPHACEVSIPAVYKGVQVGLGRMDMLVDDRLIVELKTVDALNDVHRGQVIAYLQVKKHRLGLLINFNVSVLRDGLKRVINPQLRN